MSQLLTPPPLLISFDSSGAPSKAWQDHMYMLYQFARKYRGNGVTADRPTNALETADWYWDSTLQKPIWWTGTAWKDAAGTAV